MLESLLAAPWKGNIRELANIVERAVLLSEGTTITMDCLLQSDILAGKSNLISGKQEPFALKEVIMESERRAIVRALKTTDNNRSEAARLLGISRRALYDKIEVYSI